MYLFVIYLNETTLNQMFLIALTIYKCYDLIECSRYDTSLILIIIQAHHGMRLTASCLSISKDCTIVAFNYTINE